MISFGLGIKILINADYGLLGDWSAFSLCYSLRKFLPETEVYLVKTGPKNDKQYFNWLSKMNIKSAKNLSPTFVFDSTVIMIRPMEDGTTDILSEAHQDKFTPFVSYKEGCARFVISDWINNEYPFPYADRLAKEGMCPNETQVLKLWKQMNALYSIMVKG